MDIHPNKTMQSRCVIEDCDEGECILQCWEDETYIFTHTHKGKASLNMLLDSKTPSCAAWSLAQSTPVAFPHCVLVWRPTQWTWCAAELCSLWWPSPRLRLGSEMTVTRTEHFQYRVLIKGNPVLPTCSQPSCSGKGCPELKSCQTCEPKPFKTPQLLFPPSCVHGQLHKFGVLLTHTRRLWPSFIKPTENWFPHCTRTAEQQTWKQCFVRLQLNNTV